MKTILLITESISIETLGYLHFTLQGIILIVFFYLAANVSKIKQILKPARCDDYYEQAKEYEFMHKNKEALEMYLKGIYTEATESYLDDETFKKREENLKKEYGAKIKLLGGEWPDFTVIK